MILRYLIILLTLLCIPIVNLAVDESGRETTTEKEQKTNNTKSDSKVAVRKRKQVKTLEEFIPSEEVSADRPVAFPNDI